ncbi:MAG: GvpL/GvpF family gas vesicle protein [Chloroflexaceae bacterium]|nr:GvpL/GvpF family gas vesicle protein [Chloroflexaceae bacterium]NJO06471.1 GvpL/GvpF family gas vesicle protein [Chloroflexaceae bacterium]
MAAQYLYAITHNHGPTLPALAGVEGVPIAAVAVPPLAAVVAPLTVRSLPPTEAYLWQHEAVLEALMQQQTILPVRFGTLLRDVEAVREVLTRHAATFEADLERVRGCVELSLRVLWEQEPPADPQSGRDYLLGRLAQQQQARTRADALHTPLAALARDTRLRLLETPRMLLTAAYLVEQTQVAHVRQTVAELAHEHPDLQLLCTGPWPVYHFVSKLAD